VKAKKRARRSKSMPAFEFNHVMLYVRDVQASLHFYADTLGFRILEKFDYNGTIVYARLLPPKSNTSLALHLPEQGQTSLVCSGVRLYFEVKELDSACQMLERAGVKLLSPPKQMPWGWKHAYLLDPDGHEISLYWAGALRMRKSTMK
jgi:catechol 2,3-dioxygenase-like lactoylglutathione lyase family enzyme